MIHSTEIKVRGYHCDAYGHINNARYLELLEEARWAFLEDLDALTYWQDNGLGLVVVAVTINYRRPMKPQGVVEIKSFMKEINDRNAVIHQDVVNQATGKIVADADVTFAVISLTTGRSVPLDGAVRDIFWPGHEQS